MRTAIEFGCRTLVLGVGGSASTDRGMGGAMALVAKVLDDCGRLLPLRGSGLGAVSTVDFGPMLAMLGGIDLLVATDVSSPLVGAHGAAHVFAPQKGADADQVLVLDGGLRHRAARLWATTGVDVSRVPGVGVAGGFAAP